MKHLSLLAACCLLAATQDSQAQIYTSPSGDLQVMVQFNASHDSTQCASMLQVMYQITKQNSYSNELIEVKDQFGNVITSTSNTMGTNPFTTMLPVGFGFAPDNMVVNNMVFFGMMPYKVIATTDTIYNIDNNYMLPVSDPCEYGDVSGTLYIDNNGDCSYNSGDVALNGVPISIQVNMANGSLGYGATSNGSGDYSSQVQASWMTSVDVSIPGYYQFAFLPAACQPTVQTTTTLPATGLDFAFQCNSGIDVQSGAFSSGVVRPNIGFMLHPFVSNLGCDPASGILKVVLDNRVSYQPAMSSNPATSVVGDTLFWNYLDLTNLGIGGYWNSFFSGIHLTPDNTVNIGDTLCFEIHSTVLANDVNAANNQQTLCLPVVNSYDPNAKSAVPAEGEIPANTPLLTYTIQFQNTGNAPALDVYILDTLEDATLDLASFQVVGSSHAMQPEWVAGNVIRFGFNGINLPDSMTNEPESHGYVTYRIKPQSNLTPGTEIRNTAHIYFDNNPAIITNTTLHTIALQSALQTLSTSEVQVYPNPSRDVFYLQSSDALMGNAYRVVDLWGRVLQNGTISQGHTALDLRGLPNGVYGLQVEGQPTLKLMKSE